MKITINEKISFLESFLNTSLSKDGKNINIWCPFCKHNNKNKLKLAIHLEKNIYHCWLCDKKGSNVSYLVSKINPSKKEKASNLFKSVTKKLSDFDNILSNLDNDWTFTQNNSEFLEPIDFPEDFRLLATDYNSNDPDVRDIFKYALSRGISKHKLWLLKVGYSHKNDFRRSLIIPSLDENGEVNFYTSRKIDVSSKDSYKYKDASVQKKLIIFNDINIDWSLPLTIVEGPLDLLKTNDNATCLLGSSLTEDMLLFKKIVRNSTEINLALDSDVYYKTIAIADLLSSYNIKVNILDTRCADDVGAMTFSQFQSCLETAKLYNKESKLLSKIALI